MKLKDTNIGQYFLMDGIDMDCKPKQVICKLIGLPHAYFMSDGMCAYNDEPQYIIESTGINIFCSGEDKVFPAPAIHNKSTFNQNFLIKFFPKRGVTWNSKLVGLDTMRDIVADDEVFESLWGRIERLSEDTLEINLRRGIRFQIVSR